MKIKFLFRKNLKMSNSKLGSQVAHVAANLASQNYSVQREYLSDDFVTHIVLGVSDKKFQEKSVEIGSNDQIYYIQVDAGLSEVPAGTETVLGFVEEY